MSEGAGIMSEGYDKIMESLHAFKARENNLKIKKRIIEKELDKIQKQKIILAVIISGGDPKYVEEAFNNETNKI